MFLDNKVLGMKALILNKWEKYFDTLELIRLSKLTCILIYAIIEIKVPLYTFINYRLLNCLILHLKLFT